MPVEFAPPPAEQQEAERVAREGMPDLVRLVLIVPANGDTSDKNCRVYFADSAGNVRCVATTQAQVDRPCDFRRTVRQQLNLRVRHWTDYLPPRACGVAWREELVAAATRGVFVLDKLRTDDTFLH